MNTRPFENGEIDIDELDDKLAAQLGSIKWTVESRGRIKIESKDDMRKRGMPSPTAPTPLPSVLSPWFCSADQCR
jgi:hypothetical protein